MASPTSPLPEFPEDVVRLIFEIAAEGNDPERLSYALLSKTLQSWVEPIIYREVVASGDQVYLFWRTLVSEKSTKPANFFDLHVKSLCFKRLFPQYDEVDDEFELVRVVQKCRGLQSIALRGYRIRFPAADTLNFTGDSVRRLSTTIFINHWDERQFSHPGLRKLTHLEFRAQSPTSDDVNYATLQELTSLTHLSIITPCHKAANAAAIQHLPTSLRVFILFICYGRDDLVQELKNIDEGRIDDRVVIGIARDQVPNLVLQYGVVLPSFDLSDVFEDWKNPFTTTNGIWSQAEEQIQRRRNRLTED
ncbi:hypothetical protein DFP72DRAFT_911929 [Ephemerocybe angulata]|uniref:Uncharacterized protein n=1 Tax=Ephemerocybe angulata TaxID=980116 RepID=A0A8H6LZI1_9AGAR|nr:hypothetical protein DFP72DRAFT_911929 [Tulosesus angulatus]